MLKQIKNNKNFKIPDINRDGSLITRLLPIMLCGFLNVLDKYSELYIYLFVRLIDKAFSEYKDAKEYIEEEIKTGDKLAYRFQIISHLENCLNAMSRVTKIFNIIVFGKKVKRRIGEKEVKKITKKNLNIVDFFNQETVKTLKKSGVNDVRNRIEHIEEDIYLDELIGGLSIDIDDTYQKICINKQCISLFELVRIIEDYHKFVLGIFGNLPNRMEKGVYFYDKR